MQLEKWLENLSEVRAAIALTALVLNQHYY